MEEGFLGAIYRSVCLCIRTAQRDAMLVGRAKSDQRGCGGAFGLFNATLGLTTIPATFIAGMLSQAISPSASFIFGVALCLSAGLLLLTWVK